LFYKQEQPSKSTSIVIPVILALALNLIPLLVISETLAGVNLLVYLASAYIAICKALFTITSSLAAVA